MTCTQIWVKKFSLTLLLVVMGIFVHAQTVFINEIHYDNTGADANEGVEIAGPAGTDLSCYQIILYNGSGGAAYSTTTLSGTIDDEGCGYGAVWFPISGMQNGAPDGVVLYYDPALCAGPGVATVIQFLSYEGAFTATAGVANGVGSTNIGVTEGSGTAVGDALQLTGNGTSYGDFSWGGPTTATPGTINGGQDFCGCTLGSEPTTQASGISFSALDCYDFTIDWTNGNGSDHIVVVSTSAIAGTPTDQTTYTANTVFGSGSTIAGGEFVVFNGSGTSVTVTGLTPSTTYHVSIFGYNGAACEENYLVTSPPTGSQATTACPICPHITSVLINACAGGCSEGDNEILFLNSGDFTIPVTATPSYNLYYGNSSPAGTSYLDGIVSNATAINDMHTQAGCSNTFFDALTAGSIPPFSSIMIANNSICPSSALDFSALCGSGPIYVIFANDASWTASGNFANSTSCSGGTRFFRTDFSSIDATCDYDYDYTCANMTGTDGDFVNFGVTGGSATNYGDDDCALPVTVLPLNILDFQVEQVANEVNVRWEAANEAADVYYQVQRSSDGQQFQTIAQIGGQADDRERYWYEITDPMPLQGLSYYRIHQVSNDHRDHYYTALRSVIFSEEEAFGILQVNRPGEEITVRVAHTKAASLELIDLNGRVILNATFATEGNHEVSWNIAALPRTVYLIRLRQADAIETIRFVR